MWTMAIELRGFDDLQNDMVNMAYALDQGPGRCYRRKIPSCRNSAGTVRFGDFYGLH